MAYDPSLQAKVKKICKISFGFSALFSLAIVLSDAWNLITPTIVLQRWIAIALFTVVTALIWYAVSYKSKSQLYYHLLTLAQMLVYVITITYVVYSQRGIASRAVALYAIPILLTAITKKRTMIYLTATICTVFYALASVRYFYANYGQAYKAELYVEVGFYCAIFFVVAALCSAITSAKR